MRGSKKAAFIKFGSFSHINDSVLAELKRNFPDFQFDVIDMMPEKFSLEVAVALVNCLKEYGKDIVSGKKSFMGTYNRTSFFFNNRRKQILKKLKNGNYIFTFQTQSLYDGSIPGVPHFLYTDHSHLANLDYPGWDRNLLLNENWLANESRIYQNAAVNFTMSSNITRSLIEDYHCSPDQVRCVYCGSNVQVSEDEVFDDSRFSKKNILFVGVDWQRKGGPVLVKAFRRVLEVYPETSLTIVGCNPKVDLPNCNVLGRINLEEVKACYNQASVFCLPSLLEPFGVAFLEAMAHKLPVVATNIGAIPDFIHEGKNGYLVNPNDDRRLADSLIRLLGSEGKCMAFGEYGSRLWRERYTWEKTGRRLRDYIIQFIMEPEPEEVSPAMTDYGYQ
jgi:hypothetical protein